MVVFSKKYFKIGVLLISCSLFLAACNQEQSVINDYASLVEEVETDGGNFSEQDWEDFTLRCEEVDEDMQKYTFTKEQQQELRKLQGRMAAAIGKHSAKLLKNAAKDAAEQIKAFSEGFMEGLTEENEE